MPAIMTHNLFGQDMLGDVYHHIGFSQDERDAFLLGNQGPDTFFYWMLCPWLKKYGDAGYKMHDKNPTELIKNINECLEMIPSVDRPIARAFALGFLCHYTLDSTVHPLVYFNQYSICNAGVSGLDKSDATEVHAVIECDFDEMVLYTKLGKTIADFDPCAVMLQGSSHALEIISSLTSLVYVATYGDAIPADMYKVCMSNFRIIQALMRSKNGIKRHAVANIETLVRHKSLFAAMSHRPIARTTCQFDNHENAEWANPFTGEKTTASFWDLFDEAKTKARANFELFEAGNYVEITHDLNFSGAPAEKD